MLLVPKWPFWTGAISPHNLKESLNAKTDKVVTMAVVELAAVAVAKAAVMGILCFTACCRGNQAKTAILDMTYNS